jgi:hypothetical protein
MCYRISVATINGMQVSECSGRTVTINGVTVGCPTSGAGTCTGSFPAADANGYRYVQFTGGDKTYCSASWW